ncbi:MAG: histidine phosphatase family protein [Shimia sp.]
MTTWYWVRHGPTHQRTMTGWRDVAADLSATAIVDRLAAFLPDDAVFVSSDLRRARATAAALVRGRPRLPDHPGLREMRFGLWEGRPFDEIAARDPVLSRAFWERPGALAPPGGESWDALRARVAAARTDLLGAAGPRPVVVVAHMGVILSQVHEGLGCTAYQALGHPLEALSVTEIAMTADGPTGVGRIGHLV